MAWRFVLLTVNGRLLAEDGETLRPRNLTDQKLVQKYQIRQVKNYWLLCVKGIRVHLWAYSRAAFKITIGRTQHTKRLLTNIHRFVDTVACIFGQIYVGALVKHYEAKVTQLLVSYDPGKTPYLKLTYPLLLTKMRVVKNRLLSEVKGTVLSHTPDLYQEENGASSFDFCLTVDDKRLGNIRLFNNFKGLAFLTRVSDFPRVSTVFEQFVAFLLV